MIRRLLPIILSLGILIAFGWTLFFLYKKSQAKPIVFKTTHAQVMDIVQKTVAAGAIVPRREVAIKPRVSGILQKLHVEPGQYVKANDLIAQIKIVPNVVNLNSAEDRVSAAKISVKNAQAEYERLKTLFQENLISQSDFNRAELDFQLAEQEVTAAQNNLALIKDGAIRGSGVDDEFHLRDRCR